MAPSPTDRERWQPPWWQAPLGARQWIASTSDATAGGQSLPTPVTLPFNFGGQATVPKGHYAVVIAAHVGVADIEAAIGGQNASFAIRSGSEVFISGLPVANARTQYDWQSQATGNRVAEWCWQPCAPLLVPLVLEEGDSGSLLITGLEGSPLTLMAWATGWYAPVTCDVPGARRFATA
jgi:hypothetical protein